MAKNQTNSNNANNANNGQNFQNNAQPGDNWSQWTAAQQQAAAQQMAQQAAYWAAAQQAQSMPWGQQGGQPWGQQPADATWAQGVPGYAPNAFPGAFPGMFPGVAAQPHGAGLLGWLSNRQMEQFIIGLVLGGAAAYVLGDADKRARLLRMVMKLYAGVAGSVEEFKEQIADLKAEVAAEHGGFADED